MNRKMIAWLEKMKSEKQDVTNQLVKNFEKLTSKSSLRVKVIEKINLKNDFSVLLVDVFIGEENICNLLVRHTINSLKQSRISENINLIKTEKEFDAVIVNYEPYTNGTQFGLEIKLQNELLLKSVNEMSKNWTITETKFGEEIVSMAILPDILLKIFNVNIKYGRVSL